MTSSRLLFRISALVEIATGLAALAVPALLVSLLFGETLSSTGLGITRLLGPALVSIGIAVVEPSDISPPVAPRMGLCVFNIVAAIVLGYVGLSSDSSGLLLWMTAGLHAVLGGAMFFVIFLSPRKGRSSG